MEMATKSDLGNRIDQLLENGLKMSEEDVWSYTIQILKGIEYLNRHGFVHRDIKPSNILLFDNGRIKIADFETSLDISKKSKEKYIVRGTPFYMA